MPFLFLLGLIGLFEKDVQAELVINSINQSVQVGSDFLENDTLPPVTLGLTTSEASTEVVINEWSFSSSSLILDSYLSTQAIPGGFATSTLELNLTVSVPTILNYSWNSLTAIGESNSSIYMQDMFTAVIIQHVSGSSGAFSINLFPSDYLLTLTSFTDAQFFEDSSSFIESRLEFNSVPEPASFLMFGIASTFLVRRRRGLPPSSKINNNSRRCGSFRAVFLLACETASLDFVSMLGKEIGNCLSGGF